MQVGVGTTVVSVYDQTDPAGFKAHPQGMLSHDKTGVLHGTTGKRVNPMQGHDRAQVPGWSGHLPERSLQEATMGHSTGGLSKAHHVWGL